MCSVGEFFGEASDELVASSLVLLVDVDGAELVVFPEEKVHDVREMAGAQN